MQAVVFSLAMGSVLPAAAGDETPGWDLPGLILRSRAIVLAERDLSPRNFKVKKVYLGPLLPGQELSLDISSYIEFLGGVDRDNFLFLAGGSRDDSPDSTAPPKPDELNLIRGGIKALSGGKVHGFQEPGRWGRGGYMYDEGLTFAEYEAKLREAIARVESYRALTRTKDGPGRQEALFRLLGPPRPAPVFFDDSSRFYPDALETEIIRELHGAGGVNAALEALARIKTAQYRLELESTDSSELLAAARRPDLEVDLRVAAIQAIPEAEILVRQGSMERKEVPPELPALLKDPHPEIRRAAAVKLADSLSNLNAHKKHPLMQSLAEAIQKETEPFTRLVFLGAAEELDLLDPTLSPDGRRAAALEAASRDGTVYFAWASPRARYLDAERGTLTAVAAPLAGGAEIRSRAFSPERDSWHSMTGTFPFEPALPPGDYRFHLEALFKLGGRKLDLLVKSRASEITVPAAKP